MDERWRIEMTTAEKNNLNRKLLVKKGEYETKCTSTIEPL